MAGLFVSSGDHLAGFWDRNGFISRFADLRSEFEAQLHGQSLTEASPWALSLVMFQHAQNYQRVYKALVGERGGHMGLSQLRKYLSALIREHLHSQLPLKVETPVPLEILTLYIVSSLTGLLTWWLDHGIPYPAEEINAMFRQLTQPTIEAMIVRVQ